MKIKSLSVENVKSFLRCQRIDFNKDITILIGPNGGGKTNLLDVTNLVIRKYIFKSWTFVPNGNGLINAVPNETLNSQILLKHHQGLSSDQNIEIDFYLTQSDIDNLSYIIKYSQLLLENSRNKYQNCLDESLLNFNISEFAINDVFNFSIKNGNLVQKIENKFKIIQHYLNKYEIIFHILSESKIHSLTLPILNLPINRSSNEINTSISLASFNESDLKRNIDASHSKSYDRQGSILLYSLGRLVKEYRRLLEFDDGKAKEAFYKDPNIQAFTDTLQKLGYKWSLICISTELNHYEIELEKQSIKFNVANASSGEKELLTYLFSIYFLNIRNTLIVIDEPELHLHPKWQQTLMQIFEDLLSKTGNQFLLATHSTVFVTPKTIKYITRIYSENQESKIHQIDEKNLPDSKHLLKVINSHNNEKLFFADLVVLVEGITDKIIFEKLFNSISDKKINYIFEVIDVGGKMMFKNYQSILNACNIRHAIIADLDYLKEIGSMQVKNLISKASKDKVVKNVLTDSSSIDGERLYNLIEDAILNNNVNDLSQNWEYIKSRQTDTVGFLDEESLEIITNFITSLYLNNEFILMRGNLEKYLIQGFKSKDVNKMIEIVTKDNFEEYFEPGSSFQELKDIANKILIQF